MRQRRKPWIWELVFVAAAIATGIWLSAAPWQKLAAQNAERKTRQEEMRKAEARTEALIRAKARAETALGQEELARERGYVPKGEKMWTGRN